MQTVFLILMGLSMVAVVGVLGAGLFALGEGGEFNRRYGNYLMRARVLFQALALGFFALAVLAG